MVNLYQSNDSYIVHKLKNRSEWLSFRINGIGGSESSAVLDQNPNKSIIQLYKEKKGLIKPKDISKKDCVKYGADAEKYLRGLFKLDNPNYKVRYQSNTTLQSVKLPFLLYSPDGLLIEKGTNKKGILEIKTTKIYSSVQKQNWEGKIPHHYYIQCLHGLLVSNLDFIVLKAQFKYEFEKDVITSTKQYLINKDDVKEDLEYLEKELIDFWQNFYLKGIMPKKNKDI